MRRLAWFSFSFAAGALLAILTDARILYLALLGASVLSVIAALVFRGKPETLIAIALVGLALGTFRTDAYRTLYLTPAEACAGTGVEFSVRLESYPQTAAYSESAVGTVTCGETSFRATVYLRENRDYKPGDRLFGIGTLKTGAESDDGYGRSVGIPMRATFSEITEERRAERLALRDYPAAMSKWLRDTVQTLFPEDVRGYFRALLTGEKAGLTFAQKTDLRFAGIYHALAVSGMHVSILMSTLLFVILRNRKLHAVLGIPLLVFYCLMLGGTASVVRASVMQIFLLSASLLGRQHDAPTSLGASLLLLTAVNPYCLTGLGLQLSFFATLGLLLFGNRIYAALTRRKWRRAKAVQSALAGMLSQSCGALVFTIPVTAFSFGNLPVLSILTNVLTLWAITASFTLALLACALFPVSRTLAAAAAFPAVLLMRFTAGAAHLIAKLPFAALYMDQPYPILWLIFLYAMLLFLVTRRRPGRPAVVTAIGCAAITLCLCMVLSWADQSTGVTFAALDVGQGQCLYYESCGETAAVDCGGSYADEAGELLAEQLFSKGRMRLDHLILTHYDRDHVGGTEQLLRRVRVGTLWMPDIPCDTGAREELIALAEETGTPIRLVSSDCLLPFGSGTLTVFAPSSLEGGNESCMAVLASFGDFDILTTGDLTETQERQLVQRGLPDLEILVAGHHGARNATGAYLLRSTTPEYVVISVGENRYGHPADEALGRIRAAGAAVLRTDLDGTVVFRR